MIVKPAFSISGPIPTVVAAFTATCIAVGTLWAVAALFKSHGAPMGRLLVAERACAHYMFHSERIACMNREVAASRPNIFSSVDVMTYQ